MNFLLLFFTFVTLGSAQNALASADNAPVLIEISKSSQELTVKQADDVIKRFRIAYGKGGNDKKRRMGDNKTPKGTYRIINFKADSKFYFFMQLDYPNLIDAWHGYQNEIISASEFKAIATARSMEKTPPQHTSLGGYIGIHGIGEATDKKLRIHEVHNWTEGCIALKNEEMDELRKYVSIGTQVVIK